MTFSKASAVATVAALYALTGSANANLVTNGDFENAVPSTSWQSLATTGFQDINTYRACCAPTGTYAGGPNVAFFGWDNLVGGSIWQDINTVAGQSYTVSFDYGAIARPRLQTMTASALGGTGLTNLLSTLSLRATGSANLSTITTGYNYTFIADGALTRILFKDTSAITASVDGVIDNVAVNANVPVPGSLLLLLSGALGLSVFSRKRS
jgi:hypothetical protein